MEDTNDIRRYGLVHQKSKKNTVTVKVKVDGKFIDAPNVLEGELFDPSHDAQKLNEQILDEEGFDPLHNEDSDSDYVNPYILSKVYHNFLQDNPKMSNCVQNLLDELLLQESHHPSVSGSGISLAAESPYNPQNISINMERTGYLKNYFGMDIQSKDINNRGATVRATYGTGCGTVTSGIPEW